MIPPLCPTSKSTHFCCFPRIFSLLSRTSTFSLMSVQTDFNVLSITRSELDVCLAVMESNEMKLVYTDEFAGDYAVQFGRTKFSDRLDI